MGALRAKLQTVSRWPNKSLEPTALAPLVQRITPCYGLLFPGHAGLPGLWLSSSVRPLTLARMNETFQHVLNYWRRTDVLLVQPKGTALLRDTLQRAGLTVAEDFVEFYLKIGGMEGYATDRDMWSCWDITRIVEENRSYLKPGVLFADWCIRSHFHLVRPESPTVSSVWVDMISDDEPIKVAGSFTEFFERYLARDSETGVLFDDDPPPDKAA